MLIEKALMEVPSVRIPKERKGRKDPDTHLGREKFMSQYTLGEAVKEIMAQLKPLS